MLRLDSAVQYYDWGSTTLLPELLGVEADGRPFAELWMGAHPAAASRLQQSVMIGGPGGGHEVETVLDLVASAAPETLGEALLATFGPRLPYLFKVLAVARPLSLQVHPHAAQARAGFDREEAAGVPIDAPHRLFRDASHKPELVAALSRFEALSGFRRPARILELLDGIGGGLAVRLRRMLSADPTPVGLRAAFEELLSPAPSAEVGELTEGCRRRLADGAPHRRAYGTVVALGQWYPGDPGAVASLFLNRVTLEPGEAMFVPAGAVHAYLEGSALEVMASSDNVLRAGLTPKHIDLAALLECTDYIPGRPSFTAPERLDEATVLYSAPVEEFALEMTTVRPTHGAVPLVSGGARIVLCLEGAAEVASERHHLRMGRGDVVLITDAEGDAQVRGDGVLATAFSPVGASARPDSAAGAAAARLRPPTPVKTSRR